MRGKTFQGEYMYKIYNRDLQKDLKFKNLNEVERFIINEYKNNLSNLPLKRFFDVELHRLTIKEDGKEYKLANYEAVSVKTGHDYYGNPLFMILVFNSTGLKVLIFHSTIPSEYGSYTCGLLIYI